jgi:hypothetical protein
VSAPPVAVAPRAERWLKTILGSDPTITAIVGGRIFEGALPQAQSFPAILFQMVSGGSPLLGNGAEIIWARPVYRVVAATKGNSVAAIVTLADRIFAVLHGARGGVAGAAVDACTYIEEFRDVPIDNNERYQRAGGLFEIKLRAV